MTEHQPLTQVSRDGLVLSRRLRLERGDREGDRRDGQATAPLRLPLNADERTRLRGHRRTDCGVDLLLQLPRGDALEPGEVLASADGRLVRVEAAAEPLLVVRAVDPLDLLRAAYHLGNRHVALEVLPQELRLLDDPVLADLLIRRGLQVERLLAPFLPEAGAYATGHDHHAHSHSHDHSHAHSQSQRASASQDPVSAPGPSDRDP